MPGFCRVMFVVSILLCCLHAAYLLVLVREWFDTPPTREDILALLPLLGTGALVFLSGLLGNGLLLFYKRAGLFFSWVMVFAAAASILIGMFMLNAESQELNAHVRKMMMGKGYAVVVVRYGLLALYILALKRAAMFLRR